MNRIKDTIQGISGNTGMPPYVFILLIIVLIAGTVTALTYAIKYGLYAYSTLSSAPNVSSLVNSQILALTSQYSYLSNNIKTLNLWKDSSGNTIPANQQLLINASYTGCRLAGYLGPFNDGVFNADAGDLGPGRLGICDVLRGILYNASAKSAARLSIISYV